MRETVLVLGVAMAILPCAAVAQSSGYGVRSEPGQSPRTRSVEQPGYEGAYDRAAKSWRDQRQDCITGSKGSRGTRYACTESQRSTPPLSSDFLRIPSAR